VITIIGGGITGLSAAYELSRRGIPFVLLESSPRAGGLIRTERVDGFTIEAGPDSILAQKRAAIDLCEELGLGHRLIAATPPRTAFVLKRGRLYRIPSPSVLGIPVTMGGVARYDLLPWTSRLRIALEPVVARGRGDDESVASFFRRRFGPATVDLIAEPLLGGIHAGDVEQLSIASLFPRLVEAERQPARVLRGVGRGAPRDPEGLFRSLADGMGELVSAVLSHLPAGALHVRAPVVSLERAGAGWRLGEASGLTHDARVVILAAPAHVAAALLAGLDAAAAQICGATPYVSTASGALGWRRGDIAHALAGSGFVVARRHSDARITACTWVSSKWAGRAPEGFALLRAFIGGRHDPDAAALPDARLIDIAVRDLSPVLGISAPPMLARVFRWTNAVAQHDVGHGARMAGLAARLRDLPGLFVAGSGFSSIGIPDCVAHGRAVGAAAADYVTIAR
jgi:oxygen-dependent protoporphyrinogen oxidase